LPPRGRKGPRPGSTASRTLLCERKVIIVLIEIELLENLGIREARERGTGAENKTEKNGRRNRSMRSVRWACRCAARPRRSVPWGRRLRIGEGRGQGGNRSGAGYRLPRRKAVPDIALRVDAGRQQIQLGGGKRIRGQSLFPVHARDLAARVVESGRDGGLPETAGSLN